MRLGGKKTWLIAVPVCLLVFGVTTYLLVRYFRAERLYREGQEALAEGDLRRAGQLLSSYLKLRPGDLAARVQAARTARLQGEFAEADKHLRVCEKNQGAAAEAALERRLLRAQQGDLQAGNDLLAQYPPEGDQPETVAVLNAVIQGKLSTLGLASEGRTLIEMNEALQEFQLLHGLIDRWLQSQKKPTEQVQGVFWRGKAYLFGYQYDRAAATFREALRADPEHFEARLHLAVILTFEFPAEALEHFEWLRRRDPNNRQVNAPLAGILRVFGRTEEARNMLDELLASDDSDWKVLLDRGRVELDFEQPDAAEPWLLRALEKAPTEPEILLALHRCQVQAGNPEQAKQYLERFQKYNTEKMNAANKLRHGATPRP